MKIEPPPHPEFIDSTNFILRKGTRNKQSMTTAGKNVAYFYNPDVGNYHYGELHPMKPHRLALTNELVMAYGLDDHMQVHHTQAATDADILAFHSDDYVSFLKRILPEDMVKPPVLGIRSNIATMSNEELRKQLPTLYQRFNFAADCPVFAGVWDFCSLYSGASVQAARHLCREQARTVINWSGGLHHAKQKEASGFCYVNDICMVAIELLKHHPRVLYIDIDVHHGDGVQEAFWTTDRVMTLSFHKYGDGFFPGTGDSAEQGVGVGKLYSVNVPLRNGIDDAGYRYVFRPIVSAAMEYYRPTAIILQCGADSLRGDRLGCFNVSIKGHGECIEFVRDLGVPLVVLGGGGYTIRNVSRCWAYETGILTGQALDNDLPQTIYHDYFGPDHHLHPPPSSLPKPLENFNDRTYLDDIIAKVLEQLRKLQGAPTVQWQEIPHFEPGELEMAIKVESEKARRREREENNNNFISSTSSLISQSDVLFKEQ